MYLGSWKIDDLLTFYANTTRFDTGAATDADAVPAYRVYEDETSTAILTGNMALLDSTNTAGFYSEQITLSAANGFEKGKSYAIYISATVNSVAGATHHTLQIEAEVDANTVSASNVSSNVVQWLGSAAATPTVAGVPEVDVTHLLGTAWLAPGTAGTPDVNVKLISDDATAADNLEAIMDGTGAQMTLSRLDINGQVTVDANVSGEGAVNVVNAHASGYGSVTRGNFYGAVLSGTGGGGLYVEGLTVGMEAYAASGRGIRTTGDAGAGLEIISGVGAGEVALLLNGDTTNLDATTIAEIQSGLATSANQTAILNRIGAFAGTSTNTILGFLRAMMRSDSAITPSDVGGTFDNQTDSLEALQAESDTTQTAIAALPTAAQINAEVVDVLRTDTIPDSYAADGAQPTIAQAILEILQFLTEKSVSSTTVTVNKPDGSTAAMTFTLNDAASPTSITRAT